MAWRSNDVGMSWRGRSEGVGALMVWRSSGVEVSWRCDLMALGSHGIGI